MSLELTLPFGKESNVENLIFTTLSKEYPLRIIDLMNFIRKRYGKGVTFQAVRKAVLKLKGSGVLVEENRKYLINKEWVLKTKERVDELYIELSSEKKQSNKVDSIKGEISVFSFNSLNELMNFWQKLIDDWYQKFGKGDPKINCYQSAHAWEALLHPDIEQSIMKQLKKKGIKSYIVNSGNTSLDNQIIKFYNKIGINAHIAPSSSTFDKGYYVGTYGDLVVQTQYPEEIIKRMDSFFKKSKSLKDLDLVELSNIVNMKIKMSLTVIKNLNMAKQINKSILDQIN